MAKITNATKPQSCLSAIGSSWSYADITGWNAICGEKYGLPESDALYHGLCQISGVDFKKSVGELTEVFSKIFGKFEVDSSGVPYAKANGAYIKIQDMSQGFMKATSVRIISLDCLEKEKQIQDEKSFNKIDKAKQDL